MKETLEFIVNEQSARVCRQFSLDEKDSAL